MLPELNKEYVCVHVINDTDNDSESDGQIAIPDIRSNKPFGLHDKKENQTAFFQRLIRGKIAGRDISVAAPNEISLSLSISRKAVAAADDLRERIKNNSEERWFSNDVTDVYDMLEEMQTAIVFSYRAIESFCNASIPSDYIYRKENQKGITEEYGKEQIERWLTTSEKVSSILPIVLDCKTPKSEKFWSDFKKLENLRNEIIHSKSSSSLDILAELLSEETKQYIDSSIFLLNYFIQLDPTNQIFPLGFGESIIKVGSVDDADDYLMKIEDELGEI